MTTLLQRPEDAHQDRLGLRSALARVGVAVLGARLNRWLLVLTICNCALVLGSAILYRYGNLSRAVSYLLGQPIVVASTTSIGVVEEGRHYMVHVPLTNASNRPIKIIGAQTSCTCTTLTSLPFSLAPRESRNLDIEIVTKSGKKGGIDSRVDLFTDHPASPTIDFRIIGTITPSAGSVPAPH